SSTHSHVERPRRRTARRRPVAAHRTLGETSRRAPDAACGAAASGTRATADRSTRRAHRDAKAPRRWLRPTSLAETALSRADPSVEAAARFDPDDTEPESRPDRGRRAGPG